MSNHLSMITDMVEVAGPHSLVVMTEEAGL